MITGSDVLKGTLATLRASENGRTFCIHPNDQVSVILDAPPEQPDSQRWRSFGSSEPMAVSVLPNGAFSGARGETASVLKAIKPGVSLVTSTRPPCGSDSPRDCPPDQGWQVIIVVS